MRAAKKHADASPDVGRESAASVGEVMDSELEIVDEVGAVVLELRRAA